MTEQNDLFKSTLNSARIICSRKECCCHDIRVKFKDYEDIDKILSSLITDGYINERRYVNAFIHDKLHFQTWGPIKITHELTSKHISHQLIAECLDLVPEQEWQDILLPLLSKKQKSIKANSPYELKAKVFRYAASKGFTFEQISNSYKD